MDDPMEAKYKSDMGGDYRSHHMHDSHRHRPPPPPRSGRMDHPGDRVSLVLSAWFIGGVKVVYNLAC